jgi:NSS family neurotransmitter:Na+ symporter
MLPLLVLSPISSLSLGAMPELQLANMPVFDFLDTFATNVLLPISAFLTCVYVAWVLPKGYIENELTNNGLNKTKSLPATMFSIKYVCPILIAMILIVKLTDILG